MTHWELIIWAVNGLVGLGTWPKVSLAIVRLVGALTKDPQRSKQCAEFIKLSRKDAKDLPDYLVETPARQEPAAVTVVPAPMENELRTSERRTVTGSGATS